MSKTTSDRKPKKNPLREGFAKFLEDPSRDKLHELLGNSGGEFRDLDFKEIWPAKAAVAKQVLAMGNIGGGVLVVGVQEESSGSLKAVGLANFTDKADITGWLKSTVPSSLLSGVSVHDFDYPSGDYGVVQGMKIQVMIVEPNLDDVPYLPLKDGEKIVSGTIYIRRDGMVDAANHDEVQRLLNARIQRGHSNQVELDLDGHLQQLKALYQNIDAEKPAGLKWLVDQMSSKSFVAALSGGYIPNPLYPKLSFEQFISEQIDAKQVVIRRMLGT